MSSSPLEEILELAKSLKVSEVDTNSEVKLAGDSDSDADASGAPDPDDLDESSLVDGDESRDNDDMTGMGLTLGTSGDVHKGAMKIGHVVAVPKAKNKDRYVGIHHPSGAITDAQPNRARAAIAVANLHHFMPRKGTAGATTLACSDTTPMINEIMAFAVKSGKVDDKSNLRTPQEGVKLYGKVTFADPKNKKYPVDTVKHVRDALSRIDNPDDAKEYPLNGVTLSEVKSAIVAAAKRLGVNVSGD